ncbi:21230_t:CDS:2 [Rhizophagus irregularis]|nr:21230_t:CDS:2 [Rhizophagus irregularis]
MLTLAGEFHIINENSDSISDEKPLQGTLFSTCILLANKRTLVPGIHEFFFEFLLPGDLPESMSSDLVLCEYFLKAELVSRGPDDLSAAQNKIVDVVDLSVQRTLLQTDEHIKQGLGATRYTGSRDKILDYEFLIPRIMKLDSDTFTFHARWDGLRVDNVKFWFVQTENFKNLRSKEGDESLPDRKSKIISGPFCFDLPKKEPLKLQSRPMVFQLPITQPLVRDYELSNVEIRHKLVISIQMANKNKELISLSIPITIESIVSDVDMIPPPCHITESVDQPTFQISRRSSSVVRGRRSSNNNNVNVINTQNSISTIIESASEYSVDESSQDNTIATTVTYTNNTEHEKNSNGFPQKGTHKSSFSGNMIAEKFNKFRNRGNAKKRISRASSSASTARFAPGLIEVISMRPDTNIANINNTSLTT